MESRPEPSAAKISATVSSSLARNGYKAENAGKIVDIYIQMYAFMQLSAYEKAEYVHKLKDTVEGSRLFMQANHLIQNGKISGMLSEVTLPKLANRRAVGGGAVLSTAVDLFAKLAKKNGLPINECIIAVTKVNLDVVGVAGGSLTAETGVGAFWAAMSAIALKSDVQEVSEKCL